MKYFYTAHFLRAYNKLSVEVRDDVYAAVEDYKKSSNSSKLKLHKLQGKMKGLYAFSANFQYRIIIEIQKSRTYFIDVGDHSVYE